MKNLNCNLKRHFNLLLIISINFSFLSCNFSKNITKGNRVYYNFYKKELFCDSKHTLPLSRPLIIKETKEVQLEISKFNPLKYGIFLEDTAYNRFETNIDKFDEYIALPKTSTNLAMQKTETTPMRVINYPVSSTNQKLNLNIIDSLKNELTTSISKYKTFIRYVQMIDNVYEYLATLDSISPQLIDDNITTNVIEPINNNLSVQGMNLLENSISHVFQNDFKRLESFYYQNINGIKEELDSNKKIVDINESKNKEYYNILFKTINNTIDNLNKSRKDTILIEFNKTMILYNKLQSLSLKAPILVTKSYPVTNDIQTIKIYKLETPNNKKNLYDEINIHLTHGFRIDVSGGLFFSGLCDKQYTKYSKDSIFSSKYLEGGTIKDTITNGRFTAIYSNANTKISFGGMLFFQAHSQNACNFNYGGYLGIGALFNDQTRWAASLGGSIIIGKSQRCFINIGPIISQVDRLAEPYKTKVYYKESLDNIPTTRAWKYSWMIGLSWKIGK